MRALTKSIAAAAMATVISTGIGGTASAMPYQSKTAIPNAAAQSDVLQVRGRGGAVAAGILGGLLLGGLIASQPGPYYYGPGYYYGPPPGYYYGPSYYGPPGDWAAYCMSRYRSFDPASGTYLGRDGRRHYCQ